MRPPPMRCRSPGSRADDGSVVVMSQLQKRAEAVARAASRPRVLLQSRPISSRQPPSETFSEPRRGSRQRFRHPRAARVDLLGQRFMEGLVGVGFVGHVGRLHDALAVEDDERGIAFDVERIADRVTGIQADPPDWAARQCDLLVSEGLLDQLADLGDFRSCSESWPAARRSRRPSRTWRRTR